MTDAEALSAAAASECRKVIEEKDRLLTAARDERDAITEAWRRSEDAHTAMLRRAEAAERALDAARGTLVTCGTWRHGAAERLLHVQSVACSNPVPAPVTTLPEREPVLPWVLRPNDLWDAPCPCGSTLVNYAWRKRVAAEDYHALGCEALAALIASPAPAPVPPGETSPAADESDMRDRLTLLFQTASSWLDMAAGRHESAWPPDGRRALEMCGKSVGSIFRIPMDDVRRRLTPAAPAAHPETTEPVAHEDWEP